MCLQSSPFSSSLGFEQSTALGQKQADGRILGKNQQGQEIQRLIQEISPCLLERPKKVDGTDICMKTN